MREMSDLLLGASSERLRFGNSQSDCRAAQMVKCMRERQSVAIGTQSADHAKGERGKKTVVPKYFALMDIGQMNFDEGEGHSRQRISHRHTGVGVGGGVDDDEAAVGARRCLNSINQGPFVVALETFERVPCIGRYCHKISVDLRQSLRTINCGLTATQQVEVGSVKNKNLHQRAV